MIARHAPVRTGAWSGWLTAHFEAFGIATILCIAGGLRFYELDDTGQNLFYAAGVRSMLDSWHNFFYLSFDPGGNLAIDKPPLGLWLEAGSARLFGFHYWALAAPQALAGVAATGVLFAIVRRTYGAGIALAATLFLAVTPASVVTSRNNTFDTLTMLVCLLAAWALIESVRTSQVRWIVLCAVLLGLGFNLKMAEAFLPLPAFALFAVVRSRLGLKSTIGRALLFGSVLTVVSLAWVTAVALTPASDRPTVYNGEGDSIWALTFKYNGIDRVLGRQPQERLRGDSGLPGSETDTLLKASVPPARGPLRLVTSRLGNEIGWFLPLAAIGLTVLIRRRFRDETDLLWGVWLVLGAAYFSVSVGALPQYLEAITAPLAVLAAIGAFALIDEFRTRQVLSLAVAIGVAAYAGWLLARVGGEQRMGLAVLAAGAVALVFLAVRGRNGPVSRRAAGAAIFAVCLAGPVAWSMVTVAEPPRGSATRYPVSGPQQARDYSEAAGGDAPTPASADPTLRFLEANTAAADYLVLTERALFGNSARYVLQSNRPVLTLDTFQGDEAEATEVVSRLVAEGKLKYAELPRGGPWSNPARPLGAWFTAHCRELTTESLIPLGGESQLYACSQDEP
ncbi:MAG: glycosyltransferase family 39 protein [bacterium]